MSSSASFVSALPPAPTLTAEDIAFYLKLFWRRWVPQAVAVCAGRCTGYGVMSVTAYRLWLICTRECTCVHARLVRCTRESLIVESILRCACVRVCACVCVCVCACLGWLVGWQAFDVDRLHHPGHRVVDVALFLPRPVVGAGRLRQRHDADRHRCGCGAVVKPSPLPRESEQCG